MQDFQQPAVSSFATLEGYTVRQRLLSVSLSLAMSSSATVTCSLANVPGPNMPVMPTITPVHFSGHNSSRVPSTGNSSSHSLPGSTFTGLGFPVSSVLHTINPLVQQPNGVKSWQASRSLVQNVAASVSGKDNLNLSSSSATYSASSIFGGSGLGGYSSISLNIGGKTETLAQLKNLTASELVAAEQVIGGGKQDITINAKGVATGGYFDLTSASLKTIDGSLGGSLNSLVVSSGVKVVDTVSNLNLTGSLVNMGSISVGSTGSSGASDTISAANIYNAAGATIASASGANATGISLATNGTFYNAGTISSGSTLNVSAATINNVNTSGGAASLHTGGVLSAEQNVNLAAATVNNTGFISSTSGNVNIANGGGDIAVNAAGGTVQAQKGGINFNASNYTGSGNTTLTGGNYLSKELNFNDGTGNIEANVAEVSGQVNGTACTSHITAASNDLNLGNLTVSGDPTYFNINGNVTITGNLVGDPSIAIVASGNIIGDGGSLNTSAAAQNAANKGSGATSGGDITLIAGANFTVTPSTSSGSSTATGLGDTTSTLTLTQSSNKGGGSKTGGYIDLSGFIETGITKNTPLTAVNADGTTGTGGNITMIAYAGSAANSGNILAASSVYAVPNTSVTPHPALVLSSTGAAGNGTVTLQGGGFVVFAQTINAGAINLYGATPTIPATTPITIVDGAVTSGAFATTTPGSTNLTATEILVGDMSGTGALNIVSAGLVGLEGTAHVQSATITSTKNFVEGYDLNTSGAEGVSGQTDPINGMNGGANGGNISISAAGIFMTYLDSSGSGGAGGSSANPIGGNGGEAGSITLNATNNNIGISGFINASGGGGGGGAGADVGVTTANAGGSGGMAGTVTITAKDSLVSRNYFGYTVLDFNGAAGGAGGIGTATLAGGGGGGGAAFGGGGGGGAAGLGSMIAATGGGGGGTFYILGGGGGGAGSVNGTTSTFGGGGGSSYAVLGAPYGGVSTGGAGGLSYMGSTSTTTSAGTAGVGGLTSDGKHYNTGTGGNGGNYSATTPVGGAGGGMDAPGAGGGTAPTEGTTGGNTTTAVLFNSSQNSTINITVGANTGKATSPITLDASNVNVTGTSKAAIYLAMGDQATYLDKTSLVAGSTFSMNEGHSLLTVVTAITGAAVIDLSALGGNVQVGNTVVYGGVVLDKVQTATTSITIGVGGKANYSSYGGNITAPGLSAPTVSLSADYVSGEGGNITSTISNTSNLAVSAGGTANLTIATSAGQNTNFTYGKAGFGGGGGAFDITTTGYGSISSTSAVTAPTVSISGSANVGTAAKPFLTDAGAALEFAGTGASNVFIKDSNASALTVSGTAGAGSSISLISAAQNLTVSNLVFSNVAIEDTFTSTPKTKGTVSVTLPNAGYAIGDGTGTVSITTSTANILAGTSGGVLDGTGVILKSTGGSIGSSSAPIEVDSSSLTLSAAKGDVYVSDSGNTTLNASSALTNFSVIATQLTVAGAVSAGSSIVLDGNSSLVLDASVGGSATQSVYLTSSNSISQNKTATVSGGNVTLMSDGSIGTFAQDIITKASGTLAVTASAPASGGLFYVTQTGKATLAQSYGAGSLYLTDTSALVVAAPVTFTSGTVSLTAPSVTTVAGNNSVYGNINASDLIITSPAISLGSGTIITVSSSTILEAAKGTLNITGAGTITPGQALTLGGSTYSNNIIRPTDTSITLGNATTGASDPLSAAFTATGGVNNLKINATGNFTSNLTSITVASSGGNGGSVYITAGNIVSLGNSSYAPFAINANSTGSSYTGGTISLNLTGTQNVTFSAVAGSKATGTPYLLSVDGGSGPGGNISVKTAGNLTVAVGGSGLTRAKTVTGGALSLVSGKNLAVLSDQLNSSYGYESITLQSGVTAAFTVNGGSTVVNGTAGQVQAANVSISAGGPVITATAGDITATGSLTLANPNGILTVMSSNGVPGTIVTGSTLNLAAKSGIGLGNVKTGADDPFSAGQIGNLSSLLIDTVTGNFVSDISNFTLSAAGSNNNLVVNAGNILVVGSTPASITLNAGGVANGSAKLQLTLTGTQAVNIGVPLTGVKTTGPYYLIGNDGSKTSVQTAGLLTVNGGGIAVSSTDGAGLSLTGTKGLEINDTTLLSGANNLGLLSLSSGSSTALNLGSAAGTNYVAGSNIQAANLTITDVGGITVGSTMTVSETSNGGVLDFNTKAFTNNGTVTGQSGTNAGLAFNEYFSSNGLAIVNGMNANYSGFSNLTLDAGGAMNLGNLFTTTNTLSNSLNTISIYTTGSVTFGSASSTTSPNISVAPGGAIDVHASSILAKATVPLTFVVSGAGSMIISTTSPLTIGAAKGDLALNLTSDDYLTLNSAGGLTVSSPLSVQAAQITGSSVIFNKSISSSGTLDVTATSSSGAIVTASGASINTTGSSQLALTSANAKLSSTPTDVSAATLNLAGGAFNIANSFSGGASINAGSTLSSLTYTGTADATTDVSSISTTGGRINISSGGGLSVLGGAQLSTIAGGITLIADAVTGSTGALALAANSSLRTSSGSILLQNMDTAGQINLGTGVTVYGSGTAKGIGQVSFVVGSVPPANTLVAGTVPTGVTISQSGGATVTFGNTAEPTGTISTTGSNYINAAGRNVVFSQGATGAISLGGGDSITADPPVSAGFAASSGLASLSAPSILLAPSVVTASAITPTIATMPITVTAAAGSNAIPSLSSAAAAGASLASGNASIFTGSSQNIVNGLTSSIIESSNVSPPLQGGVRKVVKATKSRYCKNGAAGHIERTFENGVTLVAPDSKTTVHTGFGSVDVAANAVALIVAFDGGVAVYNLHDNKHDSIVVSHGEHRLSLTPGRNAVLTNRNIRSFEEVNPAQSVGYRHVAAKSYEDGIKAFQAEFSLPSMFHSIGALKHLVGSSDARDQKTVRSMLKTAAILQSVNGEDAVPFEIMSAPRLTAMSINK